MFICNYKANEIYHLETLITFGDEKKLNHN